jgi:hypothetical protein
VHSSPDRTPRSIDDIEAAHQAQRAGMAGILLKSHCTITADRATIAAKIVPGIAVYGCLALNEAVGGVNPAAVDAALELGATEIFMPTVSAANHLRYQSRKGGISLLSDGLLPALKEIVALTKQHNAIIGTGHISRAEIELLLKVAADQRFAKVLITHPEHPMIGLSIAEQRSLLAPGVFFERCFSSTYRQFGNVAIEQIALAVRQVGVSSTVLTTDLGIVNYPPPVAGMQRFLTKLLELGVSESETTIMLKETPHMLVER